MFKNRYINPNDMNIEQWALSSGFEHFGMFLYSVHCTAKKEWKNTHIELEWKIGYLFEMRKTNIQEVNRHCVHSLGVLYFGGLYGVLNLQCSVYVSIPIAMSLVWVCFFFARSSLIIWLHPTKRKYNTSRTKRRCVLVFDEGLLAYNAKDWMIGNRWQNERERRKNKVWKNIWKQDNFSTKNQEGGYAVDGYVCVLHYFYWLKRK